MDVTTAITCNLFSLGGTTNSYATAGTVLTIIGPCKLHHYIKVETPSGGRTESWDSETEFVKSEDTPGLGKVVHKDDGTFKLSEDDLAIGNEDANTSSRMLC